MAASGPSHRRSGSPQRNWPVQWEKCWQTGPMTGDKPCPKSRIIEPAPKTQVSPPSMASHGCDSLRTTPNRIDLHPLGNILIWVLVPWLVTCSWLSFQSHKESRKPMPARITSVLKLWRLLGLVGLVAMSVIGLLYLTTYPASSPSAECAA